jgi:hypothetical protein
MMHFLLWIAVGSVGGLFIGVYLCIDPNNRPAWCGKNLYIFIFGLIGAGVGALIYCGVSRLLLELGANSN